METSSVLGQPPFLDRNLFSRPRVLAESQKRDERCRPSSQRPKYATLYRHLKPRLGRSLRASFYKGSVVRQKKRATHKCAGPEGGFSGPQSFKDQCKNQTMLVAVDNSTVVAYINKQGRTHLAEMCPPPVEDYDLVPLLPDNLKARHIPGCLNVMADLLSRSNQVQSTEWSLYLQVFKQICLKWFTPHVDLFATRLNHKVPLYISPVPDQNSWDIDALDINWLGLTRWCSG